MATAIVETTIQDPVLDTAWTSAPTACASDANGPSRSNDWMRCQTLGSVSGAPRRAFARWADASVRGGRRAVGSRPRAAPPAAPSWITTSTARSRRP
jgi:hypothetical protein